MNLFYSLGLQKKKLETHCSKQHAICHPDRHPCITKCNYTLNYKYEHKICLTESKASWAIINLGTIYLCGSNKEEGFTASFWCSLQITFTPDSLVLTKKQNLWLHEDILLRPVILLRPIVSNAGFPFYHPSF